MPIYNLLPCAILLTACESVPAVSPPRERLFDWSSDLRNGQGVVDAAEYELTAIPFSTILFHVEDADSQAVSSAELRDEVLEALSEWTRVTSHRRVFLEVEDPKVAHLVIAFRAGTHQDGCDLGFSVDALAHTFTYEDECLAGHIHLNTDAPWFRDGRTFDIRTVILHEIGHALGLYHGDGGPIMSASYPGAVRRLTDAEGEAVLEADDQR